MLPQPIANTGHRPLIDIGAWMRTMEDPHLTKQHHCDPAPLALTDVSSKLNEQRLDVTPLDVALIGCAKMASKVLRCLLFLPRMVLL